MAFTGVSIKRAQEILRKSQRNAKIGPWQDQITKELRPGERQKIVKVWDTLPGNTSFTDTLTFIATGKMPVYNAYAEPIHFTPTKKHCELINRKFDARTKKCRRRK